MEKSQISLKRLESSTETGWDDRAKRADLRGKAGQLKAEIRLQRRKKEDVQPATDLKRLKMLVVEMIFFKEDLACKKDSLSERKKLVEAELALQTQKLAQLKKEIILLRDRGSTRWSLRQGAKKGI